LWPEIAPAAMLGDLIMQTPLRPRQGLWGGEGCEVHPQSQGSTLLLPASEPKAVANTPRRAFKPYGTKTYAVRRHAFGLDLSAEEKKKALTLIAFLRTI
jgi:hypothetical protein